MVASSRHGSSGLSPPRAALARPEDDEARGFAKKIADVYPPPPPPRLPSSHCPCGNLVRTGYQGGRGVRSSHANGRRGAARCRAPTPWFWSRFDGTRKGESLCAFGSGRHDENAGGRPEGRMSIQKSSELSAARLPVLILRFSKEQWPDAKAGVAGREHVSNSSPRSRGEGGFGRISERNRPKPGEGRERGLRTLSCSSSAPSGHLLPVNGEKEPRSANGDASLEPRGPCRTRRSP